MNMYVIIKLHDVVVAHASLLGCVSSSSHPPPSLPPLTEHSELHEAHGGVFGLLMYMQLKM